MRYTNRSFLGNKTYRCVRCGGLVPLNNSDLCFGCTEVLVQLGRSPIDPHGILADLPRVTVNVPTPRLRTMLAGALLVGAIAGGGAAWVVVTISRA